MVIVQSSSFCVHHSIVFLFFSIIQFSFSLITTYFMRIGDGNGLFIRRGLSKGSSPIQSL